MTLVENKGLDILNGPTRMGPTGDFTYKSTKRKSVIYCFVMSPSILDYVKSLTVDDFENRDHLRLILSIESHAVVIWENAMIWNLPRKRAHLNP